MRRPVAESGQKSPSQAVQAEAPGPQDRSVVIGAGLAAVFFALFALTLVSVVTRTGLEGIDRPATSFVAQHRSAGLTTFMQAATRLGGVAATSAIAAAAIAFLVLVKKAFRSALFLALLVAAGDASYAVTKVLVHRPRPTGALIQISTYSFPSGHALGSMALFAGLAWLISRRQPALAVKVAAWLVAAVLIGVVAASRLYLGVHYATDVLGGALLGLAWLCSGATALLYWERRGPAWPAWLPPERPSQPVG